MSDIEKPQHVSDKELVTEIKDYIEHTSYAYAVMINGEWGCGKTYFINNTLTSEIETINLPQSEDDDKQKTYKTVKISLFGINDVTEISKQIFTSIYASRLPAIVKKGKPLIGASLKIVSSLLQLVSPIASTVGSTIIGRQKEISKTISNFTNLQKYVFIFDDLERCSAPIHEVLGFINNLVETNGVKVIIVANEDEIHSINRSANQELKYLVCTSGSISFDEEKEVTPDTIKQRVTILFNEDALYKAIKEKLIGKTYYYRPSLTDVLPNLIENCANGQIEKSHAINILTETMEHERYYNLRTIQAALSIFGRLTPHIIAAYKDYKSNDTPSSLSEEELCLVFEYCILAAIKHKNGEAFSKIDNYEITASPSKPNKIDSIRLQFVEDYYVYSTFDSNTVSRVLAKYFEGYETTKNKKCENDNPLTKLKSFYNISDSEILILLNHFKTWFDDNSYSGTDYIEIAQVLLDLEAISFGKDELDVDYYLSRMLEDVRNNGIDKFIFHYNVIPKTEGAREKLKKFKDNLKNAVETYSNSPRLINTNDIFEQENWGYALDNYYYHQMSNPPMSLLQSLDFDKLTSKLKTACVKNIEGFRSAVFSCYRQHRELIDNDVDKFENLIKRVEELLNNTPQLERTQKFQLEMLLDNLTKIKDKDRELLNY